MSFTVEWRPAVLSRFAEEWEELDPAHQNDVMDALDAVDRRLRTDPLTVGESRDFESNRVLVRSPILVRYRVDLRLKMVTIVGAGILPKRR